MLRQVAIAVTLLVGNTACALGPAYRRPTVDVPPAFRGVAPGGPESVADRQWSALFNDPALTTLVESALRHNFDLRAATERVLQARALFRVARADRFPIVDVSAEGVASRASREGAIVGLPPNADVDVRYAQVGFGLGWELDVWGRIRRLNEAARAQYLATDAARAGVVTTLVADVIDSYLALRSFDLELEIARRTRDVASDSVRLTEARRARGVASGLDVRQAEQLLFTSTGRIASLERQVAQAEHALTLLLGQAPGDVARGQSLESLQGPPTVPAGLPSTLLERRPDIRQAEQELIAANAQIGAAKADYFPRISLTGFLGGQSRDLENLLTAPARVATASLGVVAPLLNRGRVRGNVEFAETVQREALVRYEQSIYVALREVADALAAYTKTREQRAEQERLITTLRESTRLSTERYQAGLDSYLPVLDAQRQLFLGETDLARLRQLELASIVQLYRALGGGWSPATTAKTEDTHG
jgi:NodT family efflux transporter outer membrane factor (OMF) lipoprotein